MTRPVTVRPIHGVENASGHIDTDIDIDIGI